MFGESKAQPAAAQVVCFLSRDGDLSYCFRKAIKNPPLVPIVGTTLSFNRVGFEPLALRIDEVRWEMDEDEGLAGYFLVSKKHYSSSVPTEAYASVLAAFRDHEFEDVSVAMKGQTP